MFRLKSFGPVFLWALLIFVVCTMDTSAVAKVKWFKLPHTDKAVHFILFAIFAWLLKKIISRPGPVLIIASVYGLLIEFYQQYFTSVRSAEAADWMADTIGALIGIMLFNRFHPVVKKSN